MSRYGTYDMEQGFIPYDDCPQEASKPTNADRIRSMSDEELAAFMREYGGSAPDCRESRLKNHTCKSCDICWLDWLRKEATDEDKA